MKSFTPLLCFAATLLAVLPQTMAAPKAESPAFPDSLCGVAIEFDIPVGSIDKRQMVGPPDYWCCDGYAQENHGGPGKRICCAIASGCCNVVKDSVWSVAGYMKSIQQVGADKTTYLKSQKNCAGDCLACKTSPSFDKAYPGWQSLRRFGC